MASTETGTPRGRFLPPDPRVPEPYLFTPRTALRVAILGAVAVLVFGVLFLRLWGLQILSGSHYLNEAKNNQLRVRRIDAPRGLILDRNGRVLVTDVPGTAVDLDPTRLPKGNGRDTELRALSDVLHVPLRVILNRIRERRSDPLTPITLKVAVHDDQVNYISERPSEFRGVEIRDTFLRYYNSQALAAQVLGYDGAISPEQYKRLKSLGLVCGRAIASAQTTRCYTQNDIIGQAGVEASYDRYLRGTPGVKEFRVDSLGRSTGASATPDPPTRGNAVRLTIDIQLQRAAERAIRSGIQMAHADGKWAANGGAIVALDPRNGEVLAMASYPTYKPSVYVGKLDPEKLAPLLDAKVAAEKNYPGLNRAIQGVYPPGSTFKPVTALAGLEEHLITPNQTLPCTPTYTAHGETGPGQVFKNWNPNTDEPMTLPVAIAQSCDTYFYQVGFEFYGLPGDRGHPLQAWASRFGFGGPSGVDLGPESHGLLPTPEWREAAFTKKTDPKNWQIDRIWKPGDSIQLAIGQKDLLVTPLQMARFYALVANGGKLVTPHVVADVEQPGANGRPAAVLQRVEPPAPQQSGVDPAALAVVRDGLYLATHDPNGTSSGVFGSFPIPVAGKTGTAEKVVALPGYPSGHTEDQAWWCGYGPVEDPTIVVCAVIENGGHGGAVAAPAALQVFEQYFGLRPGQQTTVATD